MTEDARRGAAAGRGRHHIATVAHHFLGRRDQADEPAALPAVVVAAAETLPVTAFVAAGAARTGAIADGARWGLLEDGAITWSACSHLGGDERVRVLAADSFERRDGGGLGLCWHLAGATADRLDAWTAACRLPGCALPTAGRRTHLFWCVPADTAAALSPLGALARLAALVDPGRIDLIVAPRAWPGPGPARNGPAALDDRVLARLRARAADLGGRPVRLGVIGPGMGTAAAAALVTEFLHATAAASGS